MNGLRVRWEFREPTHRGRSPGATDPSPAGLDERRVLVVDDEQTIAELVAAALRYEGFTVKQAHGGHCAVVETEGGGATFRVDLPLS